jgi:hypothetical protein
VSASIGLVDLAAHQATVTEVRSDGLHLFVRRERNGQLSLASLMRGGRGARSAARRRLRARSASAPRRDAARKRPPGKKVVR